jgi:hypothetical protein
MSGIRLHERFDMVNKAEIEFTRAWIDICSKHNLTYAEELKILTGRLQSIAKYSIRSERHPEEPGKPGDEA